MKAQCPCDNLKKIFSLLDFYIQGIEYFKVLNYLEIILDVSFLANSFTIEF